MIIRTLTILSLYNVLAISARKDQCTVEDNIDYGFCPGSEQPLYLACIFIEPYPVLFEPNETVSISAWMSLFENITAGSQFKVRITKEDGPISVLMPCIDSNEWGLIGSCDYEGNSFIRHFYRFFCPNAASPDECSLPILNGTYGSNDPYDVTLPDFDEDLDFLLTGTFHIEITVEKEDGTDMTCVYFTLELGQKTTSTLTPMTTSGPETCQQCLAEAGSLISQMTMEPSLTEQTLYLINNVCENMTNTSMCQNFLETSWPEMASCVYDQWMFANLTCLYFGGCQQTSRNWGCSEVSNLMVSVLSDSDSLSIIPGAESHLQGSCFCNSTEHIRDESCRDLVTDLVPTVLPAISRWLASKTDWMCTDTSTGEDTCPECLEEVGLLVSDLTSNLSLQEQTWYMRFEVCKASPNISNCQQYISDWWPDMAKCLYNQWTFENMTCDYFGGCSRTSRNWVCQDASNLIVNMLYESPSIIYGAEQHLHGDCFCQSDAHSEDQDCQESISNVVEALLPAMSRWVSNQTQVMCGDTNNGPGTCEPCLEVAGSLISRLTTEPSLTEQTYHLMVNACDDYSDSISCQTYIENSWPAMAKCLYNDWILTDMGCYHFGGCQHSSHTWACADMGSLMGRVLADSPYITYGTEQHLHGSCYCNATGNEQVQECQATVTDLLPTILPVFSSWMSDHTQNMCSTGSDTCAQCKDEAGSLISQLTSEPSLTEQTYYLMSNACENSIDTAMCQSNLKTSWPDLAKCLYNEGILTDMTCGHFGGCEHNSHSWTCSEIGTLMARVLNDSPFIVLGAEQHLLDCYCQSDQTCQSTVRDLLPSALPALSTWVSNHTQWMCTSGSDTCAHCKDEEGSFISQLTSEPSLTEQTYYLMSNACEDSIDTEMCRSYLKTSWPDMAKCLYNEGIMTDMTCDHFGGCQHNSQTWECADIGTLMGKVLSDSPFIVIGAEQHLLDCYCKSDQTCQSTVRDLLPSILPALSTWVSSQTQWMCKAGSDTCDQCFDETGFLIDQLKDTQEEQTLYLMFNACQDSTTSAKCQQYLNQWWPHMANCLYQGWIFNNMTCNYFGGCQRTSRYWGCYEAADLIASVMGDSPSVLLGYEQQLQGSCYCQSPGHGNDPDCQETVSDLAHSVLPALSTWVTDQKNMMCTGGGTVVLASGWFIVIITCLFYCT